MRKSAWLDKRYVLVGVYIYIYICIRREDLCILVITNTCARVNDKIRARVCVRTITGDRTLTINIYFNVRRLRGNNYEREIVCGYTRVCMCALRSHTDKWNKQIRSGTYAHVLVEISRLSWIFSRAILRSEKHRIFSAYIIEMRNW